MGVATSVPLLGGAVFACAVIGFWLLGSSRADAYSCTAMLSGYFDKHPSNTSFRAISRAENMKTLAGQFGATIQAYVGHEVRLGADARQGKAWQEDAVKDFQSISSILDCYAVDENSLIALREGNPKLAAGFDWLYPEDRRKELSRAIAAGDQTSWSLFGVSEECGEAIKANFVPEEMKPRCLQPAKNLEVN